MKINELIHKLIDIQTSEGNLEVYVGDYDSGLASCETIGILRNNGEIHNGLIEKYIQLSGKYEYD